MRFLFVLLLMLGALHFTPVSAQGRVSTTVLVQSGFVVDGNVKTGILLQEKDARVNAAFLFGINEGVEIGPRIEYYVVNGTRLIPLAFCARAFIVKGKIDLSIVSAMGYGLASRPRHDGMRWGGLYMNFGVLSGLQYSESFRVMLGVDYSHQRLVYLPEGHTTKLLHLPGLNLGIALNF